MARDNTQKPKLTQGAKTANRSSSPTNTSYQSNNFDFPTLNNDGSVSDLIETHPPPGQRTPPAALSSLGLKMAADSSSDALTELNDGQYDMVDDVSDSNETVSIASDNLTSDDDDVMTPEDEDDEEENGGGLGLFDPPAPGPSAGPLQQQLLMLEHQHRQKLRTRQLALQKEYESEKERTLDSFLSEDLETPRQSTMNAFDPSSSTTTLFNHPSGTKSPSATAGDKCSSSSAETPPANSTWKILGDFMERVEPGRITVTKLLLAAMMVLSYELAIFAYDSYAPVSLGTRRDALSVELVKLTNSTQGTKSFNIDHLLPVPTTLPSTGFFGQPVEGTSEVHFQGAQPNYIVVSLPKIALKAPKITSSAALKGQKPIAFNQTKLIDGIYAFTLDPDEAHGVVTVTMFCEKQGLNVTVSHNFGRRFLHPSGLEKKISNAVAKDIALARSATSHLTAGLAATHNVSKEVFKQAGHNAHDIATRAASVAEKWYVASHVTAASVRKDIMAIQESFARAETQIDDYVADVAGRVKRSVMEPLAVAQDRAGRIRAKYFGSEAAREKVCKNNLPAKTNPASVFASGPKCEGKQHSHLCSRRAAKNGELVEKKTCGSCNAMKKDLGPKGLTKNKDKMCTAHKFKDAW